MRDQDKTKVEAIVELVEMGRSVPELQGSSAAYGRQQRAEFVVKRNRNRPGQQAK